MSDHAYIGSKVQVKTLVQDPAQILHQFSIKIFEKRIAMLNKMLNLNVSFKTNGNKIAFRRKDQLIKEIDD